MLEPAVIDPPMCWRAPFHSRIDDHTEQKACHGLQGARVNNVANAVARACGAVLDLSGPVALQPLSLSTEAGNLAHLKPSRLQIALHPTSSRIGRKRATLARVGKRIGQ